MKSETEWAARRARLCLKDGVTNLNAGTCSPTARATLDALLEAHAAKAGDPTHFTFRLAPARVETARRALAAWLRCERESLLLMNNSTFAVNTVARAIPFRPGDEVLMSDQEYHHYNVLWARRAAETGLVVRTVHLPTADEEPRLAPDDLVQRFAAAIVPATRAVFFSHVTSATGMRLPAKELCALARRRGALAIVDGAHAPGLVPVDLAEIQPDYYFANVHKWMMGATGSAFCYVRPELRAATPPLVTTGAFKPMAAGGDLAREDAFGTTAWCHAHEYQGTRDLVPLTVIPEALRFLGEVAQADLDARVGALALYCRNRLGFTPASAPDARLATCMVSFHAPAGTDAERAGVFLRSEHQFEVAFPRLGDLRPLIRVSSAWFNARAEVDALATTLERIDWTKLR